MILPAYKFFNYTLDTRYSYTEKKSDAIRIDKLAKSQDDDGKVKGSKFKAREFRVMRRT